MLADPTPDAAGKGAAGNRHYSGSVAAEEWFFAHFEGAARQVTDFFAGDGISLHGKVVADVGCGDGIIDLGLVHQCSPKELVGYDIVQTDLDNLLERGRQYAGVQALPAVLRFERCGELSLPSDDSVFDVVVSWSAFEHILDPVAVLREVRRVLKPDGVVFIQVWPFYDSAHGSHLVDWFPEGFAQHLHSEEQILLRLAAVGDQDRAAGMYQAYKTLNGMTADGLHAALREAGFRIAKLELQSDAVHIPLELADLPPSRVGISGIKLFAVPHL